MVAGCHPLAAAVAQPPRLCGAGSLRTRRRRAQRLHRVALLASQAAALAAPEEDEVIDEGLADGELADGAQVGNSGEGGA